MGIVMTSDRVDVVRCENCKYYEVKDFWSNLWANDCKIPIRTASDVPMCHRWGDECKTSPNGYCHLGERREDDDER